MTNTTYKLDKYSFSCPFNMRVEKYVCEWYSFIAFYTEKFKYEVVHNPVMGDRLIITNKDWFVQDIPFKKETFNFLPDDITVKME